MLCLPRNYGSSHTKKNKKSKTSVTVERPAVNAHMFLPCFCQHALWVFMDMLHQPLSGQTKQIGAGQVDDKSVAIVTSVTDRKLHRGQWGVTIYMEDEILWWTAASYHQTSLWSKILSTWSTFQYIYIYNIKYDMIRFFFYVIDIVFFIFGHKPLLRT